MENQKSFTQTVDIKKATIEVLIGNKPFLIEHTGSWKFDETVFPWKLLPGSQPEDNFNNSRRYSGTTKAINDPETKIVLKEIQAYKIIKIEPYIVEYSQKWTENFKKKILSFLGYFTLLGDWQQSTLVDGVKTRGSDF